MKNLMTTIISFVASLPVLPFLYHITLFPLTPHQFLLCCLPHQNHLQYLSNVCHPRRLLVTGRRDYVLIATRSSITSTSALQSSSSSLSIMTVTRRVTWSWILFQTCWSLQIPRRPKSAYMPCLAIWHLRPCTC